MQKKEVINQLFNCLTPTLTAAGFKADLKNQFYLKETDTALFNYDIRFYDRTLLSTGEKGFLIEPVAYVHVKAIEDIYKQITVNTILKKPTQFITVGAALADLEANPDGSYKKMNQSYGLQIFTEADIAGVCNELQKKFETIALSYFNNNATSIDVHHLLNNKPEKETVHMSNERSRIVKGLIAAKLSGTSDYYKLVETYGKVIKKQDLTEDTKKEYQKVQTVLESLSPA